MQRSLLGCMPRQNGTDLCFTYKRGLPGRRHTRGERNPLTPSHMRHMRCPDSVQGKRSALHVLICDKVRGSASHPPPHQGYALLQSPRHSFQFLPLALVLTKHNVSLQPRVPRPQSVAPVVGGRVGGENAFTMCFCVLPGRCGVGRGGGALERLREPDRGQVPEAVCIS